MSKLLPERPSLEHLKNEAKALKKAQSLPKLADAQLALARDYGFPSWAKLKRHVEGYDSIRDAFFDAIQAGDRQRVKQALEEAPGLARAHNPHNFGATPVTVAAGREDIPMIDLLIKAGADADARSDWWAGSFGPLDYCEEKTAEHLLKKGATLTPHAAARLGRVKELKAMLAKNPERVHERGGDGQFPLHFAKTAEIVDILVDAGADVDARDIDHEATAAQWRIKNFEVLKRLVERGASTEIFIAVALDDPDLIQKHLDQDPKSLTRKANEPGNPMIHDRAPGAPIYIYDIGYVTPLQLAANLGRERAFDCLFEKSPPGAQLVAAAWKGDRDLAVKLKGHVKSLSKEEASQVADAERYRQHDKLALMLELGFDVNAQDHEGMGPVHWAGFHGDLDALKIILPYGPNLELKNGYGGTALSTTCYGSLHGWYTKTGDYAECVQMLIEAGSVVTESMSGSEAVNSVLG
ncbi:MAG: hypothetical protein H7Y17_14095 [Chlorobia bacterium]|nr:hypothetical protein [Fimbriimonadaceae bacterium]